MSDQKVLMKKPIAEVIVDFLECEGVEYVFGVPGVSLVPFFAALNKTGKVKPILAKHEEGAAFMADGYARVKGRPGVCFATSGPGVTNLVSGVATAYEDNVPLIVLSGQVETSAFGKGVLQDSTAEGIDSVRMLEPITKYSRMLISRYKAVDEIREAFRKALTGKKGPAHLSLPKDIQMEEVVFDRSSLERYRFSPQYFDRELVIEAAKQLVTAENPAILIGSGAISSDACGDIKELAELLGIPVATTPRAKAAFPNDHPLSLGVLGFCGSPVAESYLKSDAVDVLLVIGASLNQMTTSSWDPRLAPSKCLMQIDIDPSEIGKNYKTDLPLVGDAGTVVNEIFFRVLRFLNENRDEIEKRTVRVHEEVARLKEEVGLYLEPEKLDDESVPLKPQRVVRELQEALPEDAILFVDVGNSLAWALHYMSFKRHDSFICPFGLLTMGYGISASIGGKLAAPDRPVVCIAGDGCFMMIGMEIATAVNFEVPVVWIIANNSKLGMVHDLQSFSLGDRPVATLFKQVDFCTVAEGLGAVAYRVEKPGQLREILPQAIALNKPVVIDCVIDPSEVPPLESFIEGAKQFKERLAQQ